MAATSSASPETTVSVGALIAAMQTRLPHRAK